MRLGFFMNPKSIAFIGLDNKSIGKKILENLLKNGYLGRIFIVNKKYNNISNFVTYSSILNIPSQIDVVLIFSPENEISQILKDCELRKIHNIMIFSENELSQNNSNNLIIGPATYGFINSEKNLFLIPNSFNLKKGNLGIITYSKPSSLLILDDITTENFGISKFISLGSDCQNNLKETLIYLENDINTKTILLVIEKNYLTREELLLVQKISLEKPLIIFSQNKRIHQILKSSNILLADNLTELKYIIKILSQFPNVNNRIFNTISNNQVLTEKLINEFNINNLIFNPIQNNPQTILNKSDIKNQKILNNSIFFLQTFEKPYDLKIMLDKLTKELKNNSFVCFWDGLLMSKIKKGMDGNNIPYFTEIEKLISSLNKIITYNENLNKIRSQTKLLFFKKKDKLFSN